MSIFYKGTQIYSIKYNGTTIEKVIMDNKIVFCSTCSTSASSTGGSGGSTKPCVCGAGIGQIHHG